MYAAAAGGGADVIAAYTTDGRVKAYDLLVLDDPRHAFLPYDALLLLSPQAAARPELTEALRPLVGSVCPEAMREANYLVDVQKQRPRRAAARLASPRPPSGVARESPEPRRVIQSASYAEGPAYFGDRLYYTEYGAHAVNVWDGVRSRVFWKRDGTGPTAVLPLGTGEFLVACYDANCLAYLGAQGQWLRDITHDSDGRPFVGPNDLVPDNKGGVYFSASGAFKRGSPAQGKLYYLKSGKAVPVTDGLHYPNGLAVTDAGRTLLVAEHLKSRILKFEIGEDGTLGRGTVWKHLSCIQPDPAEADWYTGPDGLKVDSRGNVYICQFGASRLLVTDPSGTWIRTIWIPSPYVTNLCFGRTDDTLFVTGVEDPWTAPYPGAVYEVSNR
jgi:sugar lactone lactonase YvrE